MTHPNAIDLETFACGDPAPHVASHVESCEACRAYVEKVRPAPRELPRPVLAAAKRNERNRMLVTAGTLVAPLAIAALLLLWIRPSPKAEPRAPHEPVAPVAMGTAEPDITFKGGIQVAVVRERSGDQARFTDEVRVRPGDRLRLEVALDRPQAILGAVLGDDGSYLEIMPDAVRDAGTHFSEKSARVDAEPTRGTLVVGPPDLVRRAKVTHDRTGLRTIRVEWEGSP